MKEVSITLPIVSIERSATPVVVGMRDGGAKAFNHTRTRIHLADDCSDDGHFSVVTLETTKTGFDGLSEGDEVTFKIS